MFTFPEVDIKSIMSPDISTGSLNNSKSIYILQSLGFQSRVNLAMSHLTKWLSRSLVGQ